MQRLSLAWNLFAWLFIRLPLAFSLPFAAMSLWWIFGGFRLFHDGLAEPLSDSVGSLAGGMLPGFLSAALADNLGAFFEALIVIALFGLGFVVAYNLAALLNWVLLTANAKPSHYEAGPPQPPASAAGSATSPFANVHRIGIVLAGGGAKGAFQAGAMKAIYRFLEQHGAIGKVSVISSTSIGSWNALFWLADLIRPESGWDGCSIHESWWRRINVKSLAAPSWWVPFLRNAFLSSRPWEKAFDHLFDRPDVVKRIMASPVHFYMTRSDVRSGNLEFATNNPHPPKTARVTHEHLDASGDPAKFMEGLRKAVFASMDLPPLFPYTRLGHRLFEDGGVIDNLPISFAALEHCDLVFILPLNSDFEEEPNETSILARLLRVMDVRQGALERSGFKMLYLYNELAALRHQAQAPAPDSVAATAAGPLATALKRDHEPINVFAICPLKSFVQQTINTRELWKPKEAGIAFDVMYRATEAKLPSFQFKPQKEVRVALVNRTGGVRWDNEF